MELAISISVCVVLETKSGCCQEKSYYQLIIAAFKPADFADVLASLWFRRFSPLKLCREAKGVGIYEICHCKEYVMNSEARQQCGFLGKTLYPY